MTVWFTSDLHIGHPFVANERASAAAITAPWAARNPRWINHFATRWHDDALARNWDRLVRKDDLVWVLGDASIGGVARVDRALAWIDERPGRKKLIAGNHDPVHPGINRDYAKWLPRYLRVFEEVLPFARRRVAGQNVLLSHFPYHGDSHSSTERYTQWRLPDMGEWLLHGHTHSSKAYDPAAPRSIHVGVDAWSLTPVPLDAIERIIASEDQPSGPAEGQGRDPS